MKKNILSIILCVTMIMVPFYNCYADSSTVKRSEELTCDGIKYSIEYFYDEEWYIINVTDTHLKQVTQVKRNLVNNDIYLNDELISFKTPEVEKKGYNELSSVNDVWITLSSGSTVVSFKKASTYVLVATILAGVLNSMVGVAGVISAMGVSTLAALAGLTANCTISMTLQYANASPTQQIYRNIWYVSNNSMTEGPFLYSWIVQAEI